MRLSIHLRSACCGAILVLAASAATAEPRRVAVDRIAAVVNDRVILASEVELRMAPLRGQAASIPDAGERARRLEQLSRQLLDRMIDDELILQAGKEARITVDNTDVDAALELLSKEHGLDKAQLAAEMKRQGMSRATLRDDVLRQRAINQLVASKIQITSEDVASRYAEMQRRSELVTAVDVSQIVFELGDHPTEQQLGEARRRAERARDRIRAGEDFARVAGEVTEDATTRATGGRLGWLELGTLSAEWEPIVRTMAAGEVRGPVRLGRGIYLLRANDVKRRELQPLDQMRDQLASELRHKALAKHVQAWVAELRKKAHIDIKP